MNKTDGIGRSSALAFFGAGGGARSFSLSEETLKSNEIQRANTGAKE